MEEQKETKKKILLIYPPSPVLNREDRCQQPTKELLVIPPLPPSDLMYMAAVAEKAGLEAKIEDYSQGGNYEKDLQEFQPDYVVINIATPTLENDLNSLETAKAICPNVVTIAKGAAFLTLGMPILEEHKALDIGILGETEETLREILEGRPKQDILGIYYRDDLLIKFTGKRPFIEDVDSIPFPARHLVDNSIY
ncbi:MAG: B12-binding domain-containing radical SAM protein, partial [Candidatus Gastranaerophilaceae bacterium]